MSTEISNERLELAAKNGVANEEAVMAMAKELLALRNKKGRTMPRHEFAQMVNELRDLPATQSKRELIVRILHAFNINPESPEGRL